jgi:lipoprotein-anchoring transpeptidase ErfK/SrfK
MKRHWIAILAMAFASTHVSALERNAIPETLQILGAMPDPQERHSAGRLASSVIYATPGKHSSRLLTKEILPFDTELPAGSIVVRTQERKLYFVLPGGQAAIYPIGVGKEGFAWSGSNHISRKAVWPDWRPPEAMIRREASKGKFLPTHMAGGVGNPLGARALYIGSTQFRIHGTTQPWSIGRAVSSGCIRMLNEHVIDLYDQVQLGAKVVVE